MTSHVLLIEPSKLYQQIISTELSKTDIKVEIATSAQSAREILKKHAFLLIFCAHQLPDSDGISLAGELRQQMNSAAPILLLTVDNDVELIRKALESGITEVIHRERLADMSSYIAHLNSQVSTEPEVGANILLLEDNLSLAMQTKANFTTLGYKITAITKAEDAVSNIRENNYDLIITDILLAGQMTGIALVRKIRAMEQPYCVLPILAISGLDKASQRIEALRQGASDFVTKPIVFAELLVRARNLIRAKLLADKVREQEQHLKSLAITDSLTGLYNRHYLAEAGMNRITESIRHRQALSIIIIDLDFFKKINDNHGHAVGDLVLKEVGQLLRACCRREDFAVRFGGEEFVLVLPHCEMKDAFAKAQSIRKKIKASEIAGLSITASFGVAGENELSEEDTFERLFQEADTAVYSSKENGRDQITLSESLKDKQK